MVNTICIVEFLITPPSIALTQAYAQDLSYHVQNSVGQDLTVQHHIQDHVSLSTEAPICAIHPIMTNSVVVASLIISLVIIHYQQLLHNFINPYNNQVMLPHDTRTKTKYQLIRLKNYIKVIQNSSTDMRILQLIPPLQSLTEDLWVINKEEQLSELEYYLIKNTCEELEQHIKKLGNKSNEM
jgi:hypothetical protein